MGALSVEIGEWVRTRWVGIYQIYRVLEVPNDWNPGSPSPAPSATVFVKRFLTNRFRRLFGERCCHPQCLRPLTDDDRDQLQRFIKDHPDVFEEFKSYKPRPIDVVFNARIGIPSKLTRRDVEKMIATERMFTAFEIGPYLQAKGFSTTEFPCWTVQFVSPDHDCRDGYLRFKFSRVLAG